MKINTIEDMVIHPQPYELVSKLAQDVFSYIRLDPRVLGFFHISYYWDDKDAPIIRTYDDFQNAPNPSRVGFLQASALPYKHEADEKSDPVKVTKCVLDLMNNFPDSNFVWHDIIDTIINHRDGNRSVGYFARFMRVPKK